ncbi:MAG: phosphohydrolase [Bacteroidetes bacterium GWF2_40_14]|nr:MAG: phosphohydrolase [Bacteroidetes bacterium GWF2_40_14]
MVESFKIINDPVHGFVDIPSGLILEIIEHPYFQRLRDIKQLGLTNLVYPGATHSRLLHAIGAMHLMKEAITNLQYKGVIITKNEEEASLAAILLHDIGHGPFSHALENNIIRGVSHEEISLALMKAINKEKNGRLTTAIEIFEDKYEKHFLHQLVSSQLDVDRLDYLKRDSFFSGVAEGMIGLERIIKMLNVHDNSLVVEQKGIYSIEKFLISRRLMYWQVYLHKTVIAAEQLLIQILKRARLLTENSVFLPGSPAINFFLKNNFCKGELDNMEVLGKFTLLDDTDIMSAIKQWQFAHDKTLSMLCKMLTARVLPKIELSLVPFSEDDIEKIKNNIIADKQNFDADINYFVQSGEVRNSGYDAQEEEIKILSKDGNVQNVYLISDMLSAKAFSQITKKYFLCTAKI